MAATSSKGRVIAGSFFKRLATQTWAAKSRDLAPLSISRRESHYASYYEKEVEEQVRPALVPNHVIDDARSDKYWGPHPTTGIFGPADLNCAAGRASAALLHQPAAGNGASALDQTVRFRTLDIEDLEKPHHA